MRDQQIACPKCESKRWMTGLPALDLSTFVAPPGLIKEAQGTTDFKISLCGDCGYTEFYATRPLRVWDEWCKQNR